MNILLMLSEKGKPLLVVDGAKFYLAQNLKSGEIKWRCVQKLCTAKVYTNKDNSKILKEDTNHNHAVKEETLARQKINNSVKLKAKEELFELPRKLISSEIRSCPEISKSLTRHDIYNIRKTMYNARRSRRKSEFCFKVENKTEDNLSVLKELAKRHGEYCFIFDSVLYEI